MTRPGRAKAANLASENRIKPMRYYECYLYRADGSVCGASPLLRKSDDEAAELARQILAQRHDAQRFELWQEDRRVAAESPAA